MNEIPVFYREGGHENDLAILGFLDVDWISKHILERTYFYLTVATSMGPVTISNNGGVVFRVGFERAARIDPGSDGGNYAVDILVTSSKIQDLVLVRGFTSFAQRHGRRVSD